MGIVQVCEDQDWHAICADGWDTVDANAVCRQLGFASKGLPHEKLYFGVLLNFKTLMYYIIGAVSGRSNVGFYTPFLFDAVACNGSEDHILDCDRERIQECTGEATVLCRGTTCI